MQINVHDGERDPILARRSEEQTTSSDGQRCTEDGNGLALLLLVLLSTGANWAEASLGPMKSLLLKQLAINNTQFGVLSAATQLANTLVPLFVVWVDLVGPAQIALASALCVCTGTAATALGADAGSFALLVLGRAIQGLGVIVVDTAATKLLVRRYRSAGGLSLAVSLNFACDRLAATLSKISAVPVARWSDERPGRAFWLASLVSLLSVISAIGYRRLFERADQRYAARQHVAADLRTVSCVQLLHRTFASLPPFFVFMAVTQFYQPIAVFNNLAADIIRWKGTSPELAGYMAGLGQAVPIIIAPVLGISFDRFGHRMEYVPITALILGTSFALLAYTYTGPLTCMLLFSLGNALNSPPYLCSLAILLRDQATFGCAWGVWKALMQAYQIIMNTSLGRLQDRTPGQGYQWVLTVLLVSKAIEFVWGLCYVCLDRYLNAGILAANEKARRRLEAEAQSFHRTSSVDVNDDRRHRQAAVRPGLQPHTFTSMFAACFFTATVLCAWTMFFSSTLQPA